MDLVDTFWLEFLDEDARRGFFGDKARLYDAAVSCAVKRGSVAEAIEHSERGRTRYLGDLIARRHLARRSSLEQEVSEFWSTAAEARDLRVPSGSAPGRTRL